MATMLGVSRDYRLLYNMVHNRFRYTDNETLIDWDVVEDWLIAYGMVGLYKDDLGLLAYQATPANYATGLNGLPSRYTLLNPNTNLRLDVDADDPRLFIIKDTILGDSWNKTIMEYAEDLHDLRAVRKSNLNAMKSPVVVKTTRDNLANAKALFAQYQEATVPIFEDGDDLMGSENSLSAINLSVSDLRLEKIGIERERLINEFAVLLGYTALTNQKRERMLVDEISQGSAITEAGFIQAYENRKKACEWLKGLDITVSVRSITDDTNTSQTEDLNNESHIV